MTAPLPPPGAPDTAAAAAAFSRLCVTIAKLRDPVHGCPWDLKQTHASLRRYMIEEAYEAAEAMVGSDAGELRDELGDVLLQVVLNAQLALDAKAFSVVDVINSIDAKMRRRHPHVFAEGAAGAGSDTAQIHAKWQDIKAEEKAAKAGAAAPQGLFAEASHKHPATAQAYKIGQIAAKVRFDWDDARAVWDQVRSEIAELDHELTAPAADQSKIAEELGDVYFSLAQLARHLKLDPEIVAVDANRKFLRRFRAVEELAAAAQLRVADASRDQLEDLWRRVKEGEAKR